MAARRGRPPLREEDRERTRQRIIAAALAVFRRAGFLAASLEDVATEAGLNRGTIYLYFDSKAQILLVALRSAETDIDGFYDELFVLERRSEVERFFERVLARWRSDLALPLALAREAAIAAPDVASWLSTTRRRHIKRTAARLEERGVARSAALARAEVFNAMLAQIAADRVDGALRSSTAALRDALALAYATMFEPPFDG